MTSAHSLSTSLRYHFLPFVTLRGSFPRPENDSSHMRIFVPLALSSGSLYIILPGIYTVTASDPHSYTWRCPSSQAGRCSPVHHSGICHSSQTDTPYYPSVIQQRKQHILAIHGNTDDTEKISNGSFTHFFYTFITHVKSTNPTGT